MQPKTFDLAANVTIGIVPRERFSHAEASLRSFYEHTPAGIRVIYVDGNAPKKVTAAIREMSSEKGFELIRLNYYLSPQQARNLIVPRVKTKYVVFLDNDIDFSPGWLEKLIGCAEETGAAAVAPLYLEGSGADIRVHMAGGHCWGEHTARGLVFKEVHEFYRKKPESVSMSRHQTELLEFHAFCVRMDLFERTGTFDEAFLSAQDHTDFSLALTAAGDQLYFEPESRILYFPPPPFELSDVPYLMLRWSDQWNRASARRFEEKWGALVDDHVESWLRNHRRSYLLGITARLKRILGSRISSRVRDRVLYPIETVVHRLVTWWIWERVKKSREEALRTLGSLRTAHLSASQIADFCRKKYPAAQEISPQLLSA